jgi:hypothetical protein
MVMALNMIGVAVGPNGLWASPSQNFVNFNVPPGRTMVFQAPEGSEHPVL